MAKEFDVCVVGSGPGGYVAAIRASQLGFKTAIIERRDLGGVCLNIGCIPTKALLKTAEVMEYINHAKDYGINVKEADADFPKVIKRSRRVADKMSKGVQFLMKANKVEVIRGHGKFNKNKELEILDENDKKTETVKAKHFIVATGARARELPHIKIDGKTVVGYEQAMKLEKQPKRMVVMGAGAIGIEFAYFYHSLGTEVTIVEVQDNIVPVEDKEVSKELEKIYKKAGMTIHTGASVEKVEKKGNAVKVTVKTSKGEEVIDTDVVLSAVGVVGNTENLGLEEAGVKFEKNTIEVDKSTYKTSADNIYAIGDVTGAPWLAHKASHEGIVCVEQLAGLDAHPIDYNNIPGCTYCIPQIASVGYSEQGAKDAGYKVKVGKFPFSANGKATGAGHTEGFVKVIFDEKYGEWLGCHMLGADVTEMIAEAVVARNLETTGHEIINAVHPHPTISECIMEAAAEAYGEGVHLGTQPKGQK